MANKNINILLVEDDEVDIQITLRAFKKANSRNNIFIAHDGLEALDYLYHRGEFQDKENYPLPDFILLDINMPRMNGFEFLDKIKKDPNFKLIPVSMLTSSRNNDDVEKSYSNYACSYIPKPVCYEDFENVVTSFNYYWQNISLLPQNDIQENPSIKSHRILLIDDDKMDQKIIKTLLSKNNFKEIYTAETGEEGVSAAKEYNPGIVLVDLSLPGIDGLETCKRIKKFQGLKSKVIVITGLIELIDVAKAKESGVDDYCLKTIDCAEILEKVANLSSPDTE